MATASVAPPMASDGGAFFTKPSAAESPARANDAAPIATPKHSAIPQAAIPTVASAGPAPPVRSTRRDATSRAAADSGFLSGVIADGSQPRMPRAATATAPNSATVDNAAGQLWTTATTAWALVWVVT